MRLKTGGERLFDGSAAEVSEHVVTSNAAGTEFAELAAHQGTEGSGTHRRKPTCPTHSSALPAVADGGERGMSGVGGTIAG